MRSPAVGHINGAAKSCSNSFCFESFPRPLRGRFRDPTDRAKCGMAPGWVTVLAVDAVVAFLCSVDLQGGAK